MKKMVIILALSLLLSGCGEPDAPPDSFRDSIYWINLKGEGQASPLNAAEDGRQPA